MNLELLAARSLAGLIIAGAIGVPLYAHQISANDSEHLERVETLEPGEIKQLATAEARAVEAQVALHDLHNRIYAAHKMLPQWWPEWRTRTVIDGDYILFYRTVFFNSVPGLFNVRIKEDALPGTNSDAGVGVISADDAGNLIIRSAP